MNVDRQASDWLLRRSEGNLPSSEESAFQRWLAADAIHEKSYRSLKNVWEEVGELKHLGALAPLNSARRWYPWAAAAALAGIVVGVVLTAHGIWPPVLKTQVAQVREFTLPDGTQASLGALSS